MKRIFNLVALLLFVSNIFSQANQTYKFRKPISVNATTWKFASVVSGVDAIVTVIGSKNASINMIDDSAIYAHAWQPNIRYTKTMTNSTDSSYMEFNIEFVKSSNGTADIQSLLAMTIVDCDGNSSFREMVKVSLPAVGTGINGSSINLSQDTKWLKFIGASTDYSGIDTSVYQAMAQVNFVNVSSYTMRVGVLGKITAGTNRQASFYFKAYKAMVVPLPVTLNHFSAILENNNTELSWSTSSEENLSKFEVMRSFDGINFQSIGTATARGNSNELNEYQFLDINAVAFNQSKIFYQLRMIDENGDYKLSNMVQLRMSTIATVSVYPNPSSDYLNVNLSEAIDTDAAVSISDINGKNVELNSTSNNGTSIQFNIQQLENGVYFLNLLNNDGSVTATKFIKR
ncbi:MAG: T9SS type A sorting domain-containing protein [bacterium]|nr:T9SS type A sorting domain-containing protein [bacterium]